MPDIKAVIFDWGGVLIDNPGREIIDWCARGLGVTPERFGENFWEGEPDFQRGLIDEETFWKRMCARLGVPPPKPGLWGEALRSGYRPRTAVFALADRLRKSGRKIALLSNTEMPAVDIYRERLDGFFNVVVLSCLEGVRKPDAEIYLRTIDRLGVKPAEALFVDDRRENIDAAENLGMKGLLESTEEGILTGIARLVGNI